MWYEEYERKPLIQVKGGIKSQNKRGEFGTNWWSKRWIEALESFQDTGRLSRGRSYARKGQVISIEIEQGLVTGCVQGTRKTPYHALWEGEGFGRDLERNRYAGKEQLPRCHLKDDPYRQEGCCPDRENARIPEVSIYLAGF